MSVPKLQLKDIGKPSSGADSPSNLIIYPTPRKTARTNREYDLCPHSARRVGQTPRDELHTPRLSCYTTPTVEGDGVMRSAFPREESLDEGCEHHKASPRVSPKHPNTATPRMVCIPVTPRVLAGVAKSSVTATRPARTEPTEKVLTRVPALDLRYLRATVYGATLTGLSTAYVLAKYVRPHCFAVRP